MEIAVSLLESKPSSPQASLLEAGQPLTSQLSSHMALHFSDPPEGHSSAEGQGETCKPQTFYALESYFGSLPGRDAGRRPLGLSLLLRVMLRMVLC